MSSTTVVGSSSDVHLNKECRLMQLLKSSATESADTSKRSQSSRVQYSSKCLLSELRVLAMGRHGLMNNTIRKLAWPRLAEVTTLDIENIEKDSDSSGLRHRLPKTDSSHLLATTFIQSHLIPPPLSEQEQESQKDYEQVLMDVNRSLKRFPPGLDEVERMSMHGQLVSLILRVLKAHPHLHYYQGYHDIAVTFLIVLGEDVAAAVLAKISQHELKEFMGPTMDSTVRLLQLLPALLQNERPQLAQKLRESDVQPFYALPWVITWFGHVLGDLPRILRLYDFFLSTHPLMPVYLSAAIVLHREEELVQMTQSEEGSDSALLHHYLTNLPPNLPLELLIRRSCILFRCHPPHELWKLVPQDEHIPGLVANRKTARGQMTGRKSGQSPIRAHSACAASLWRRKNVIMAVLVLLLAVLVAMVWRSRQ